MLGKLALACAVQGRIREPEDVRSLVLAAGFTACERVAESPMRFSPNSTTLIKSLLFSVSENMGHRVLYV